MSQNVPLTPPPALENVSVAIVSTEWNSAVNEKLVGNALGRFRELGYGSDSCKCFTVPGAVELTFAASQLIESGMFDAVIVFGCVIRGGTPHFDYVCQSVTQGVTQLNADVDTPVIFGVLTVDNEQQALDRAGGEAGDKGSECVDTALKMIAFKREVENL